jgi:hypothetical protein
MTRPFICIRFVFVPSSIKKWSLPAYRLSFDLILTETDLSVSQKCQIPRDVNFILGIGALSQQLKSFQIAGRRDGISAHLYLT